MKTSSITGSFAFLGSKMRSAVQACCALKNSGKEPTADLVVELTGVGGETARVAVEAIRVAVEIIRDNVLDATLQEPCGSEKKTLEVHKKVLERTFDQRVREEASRLREEASLPHYLKRLDELREMLNYPRNSVMSKGEYKTILMCLHPDAINSRTVEQMSEAFRLFNHYKHKMFVDDEENKKTLKSFPKTLEEMLARKAVRAK